VELFPNIEDLENNADGVYNITSNFNISEECFLLLQKRSLNTSPMDNIKSITTSSSPLMIAKH